MIRTLWHVMLLWWPGGGSVLQCRHASKGSKKCSRGACKGGWSCKQVGVLKVKHSGAGWGVWTLGEREREKHKENVGSRDRRVDSGLVLKGFKAGLW